MKSTTTVKENYEFRRMYAKGKSGVSSCLVVYYRKNRLGHNRLGVTVMPVRILLQVYHSKKT